MALDNLIISSYLSNDPPSDGLCFRHLTMEAKYKLKYNVLLESEKKSIDECYKFLKEKGWFDFVDDFVLPEWREEGIRLDTELNYPLTIQVKYIKFENVTLIVEQIKVLKNITN